MHENLTLLGIVLVILGYGYFSRLLSRLNISGPMVFTLVGLLLSPLGFGTHPVHPHAETVQLIAEVALVIILFSDAAGVNLHRLRRQQRLPFRLLFLSLPLTILFNTGALALFFPQDPPLFWLLAALILAPTDAALGKAVVTDSRVPEKLRNTLNVESGLNDGIVFPLFVTVLSVIGGAGAGGWLEEVAAQIALGAFWGAVTGTLGAYLANLARQRAWTQRHYFDLIPVALALFSYYLAEFFGGNGFIAAYFAGLYAGNNSPVLKAHIEAFAESEGELLAMIVFLVFGLVFVPETAPYWSFSSLLFALLSLTLLRMVPTALSLAGTRTASADMLFLGWFGPRGVASVLYMLIAVETLRSLKGYETLFGAISLTIFLSIFAHGLSASALAARFGGAK